MRFMHSMPKSVQMGYAESVTDGRLCIDMTSAARQSVQQACRIASGSQLRSRPACSRVDRRGSAPAHAAHTLGFSVEPSVSGSLDRAEPGMPYVLVVSDE